MTPQRKVYEDYALQDDYGHDFTLLHFYASQSFQRKQLDSRGFGNIEVFDRAGHVVTVTDNTQTSPDLMYMAHRC
ncbi:MAG TPA: hypothetical protein VN043_07855 [Rhodanobacter sp.]|nr:hypothetical protein [Rhodanobacter sp.]